MRKFVKTRTGLVFLDSISAIEIPKSKETSERPDLQTVVVYTGANPYTVYVGPDPETAYQELLDRINEEPTLS